MYSRILSLVVFAAVFLAVHRTASHLPPIPYTNPRPEWLNTRSVSPMREKGDAPAIRALFAAVTTDPDPKVREHAATALGALRDQRACLPLVEALLRDPDPRVREHAAEALGALGNDKAREALVLAMLADSEPRVRAHAAEALEILWR
jgi:HEAT repeat protein